MSHKSHAHLGDRQTEPYLHHVLVGRPALHSLRHVHHGTILLNPHDFDRDRDGLSGENGGVENLRVLRREEVQVSERGTQGAGGGRPAPKASALGACRDVREGSSQTDGHSRQPDPLLAPSLSREPGDAPRPPPPPAPRTTPHTSRICHKISPQRSPGLGLRVLWAVTGLSHTGSTYCIFVSNEERQQHKEQRRTSHPINLGTPGLGAAAPPSPLGTPEISLQILMTPGGSWVLSSPVSFLLSPLPAP